jgi:hypothetical protein
MAQLTKISSRETIEQREQSFGIYDKKGREIGGRYVISQVDFEPLPEGSITGYLQAPGRYIIGCCHALRDGKGYGALHRDTYFASLEEAQAAADKYFASAAKRAAKR